MKLNILLINIFSLWISIAKSEEIMDDLRILNTSFDINISMETLGQVVDLCTPQFTRAFTIEFEGNSQQKNLTPLSYLAHFASVKTLILMSKSFEYYLSSYKNEIQRRNLRFIYYDGLLRVLEWQKKWKYIYKIIKSDNDEKKHFSINIMRRLVYILIKTENSYLLQRFHNASNIPTNNEKSTGCSYPNLYKYQPIFANLLNHKDMKYFVIRDLIENLINNRGTNEEEIAKDMIKFYINFYSNSKNIVKNKRMVASTEFLFDTKNIFENQSKKFFIEDVDFIMHTVQQIVDNMTVLPDNQGNEILETESEQIEKTSTKIKKKISFQDMSDIDTPKKKGKNEESFNQLIISSCSDLAYLIMNNHPDDFIAFTMQHCSNPSVCIINKEKKSVISLLIAYRKFSLLEMLANEIDFFGTENEHREECFEMLLNQRQIGTIIKFLISKNLYGNEDTKSRLLAKLFRAYHDTKISCDEFLSLVTNEKLFQEATDLCKMSQGVFLQEIILEKILSLASDNNDKTLLYTLLKLTWFIDSSKASLIAHEQFMKVALDEDEKGVTFWLESKLFTVNEME